MQTEVGMMDQITLQDGTSLEVMVERAIDLGDGWLITYSVPEWQSDDGKKYFLQDYYYPREEDYSGIVRTTGMPVEYMNATMKDFDWSYYRGAAKAQMDLVNRYLFNMDINIREGVGLYLWSEQAGSGKTMLACIIANELIKRGLQVKFVTANEYLQAHKENDTQKYKDCSVLILDDIGAEDDKQGWVQSILFSLVNYRYSQHKLTFFTSNMDVKHCSNNDRMVSRINKMALPIRMPEYSVRDELAERWQKQYIGAWR